MNSSNYERGLIVISYYAARESTNLVKLTESLKAYTNSVMVVTNVDNVVSPVRHGENSKMIINSNVGMNIGAWNRGFKEDPEADYYLFLQDECFLKRDGFWDAIIGRFKADPTLGMLGESFNHKWARSWESLSASSLNSLEDDHLLEGARSRRVDVYLDAMRRWSISPGGSGAHLRSLVWALSGSAMRRLGGFPVGKNRGECIAAEIAVSRQLIHFGYRIDQVCPQPFTYFGHSEWRSDGLSKL